MKAFADSKINVNEKLKLCFARVQNIVGNGENAGYQDFFPFPALFSKDLFINIVKIRIVW